jgi:hypothetical protein
VDGKFEDKPLAVLLPANEVRQTAKSNQSALVVQDEKEIISAPL